MKFTESNIGATLIVEERLWRKKRMKTRAAVMYKHNEPVIVEELELDEPKANEVLVRTAASGVCHSDLVRRHGCYLL